MKISMIIIEGQEDNMNVERKRIIEGFFCFYQAMRFKSNFGNYVFILRIKFQSL